MIRYPQHIERQYVARLLRRLRVARILVTERVVQRQDNEQDRVGLSIGATRRVFEVTFPITTESLLPTARATDAFTTRAVTRAVSQLVAVNVEADNRIGSRSAGEMRDLHRSWARQNVNLITSMEADTFDDLADHVAAAVAEGRTDLAQVIQDRFGVAESRAKLIARDQIGSLNSRITEARQTQLGIDAYEWSSSGDQRVRPLHRKLDGTIRRWDDPHPTEGHPGRAIQCFLSDQLVAGSFLIGVRSWFTGRAVEIVTAAGCRLRVTGNHPVLTARGWVHAAALDLDDQVLRDLRWVAPCDAIDVADRPSAAVQVFNALSEPGSFPVIATVRPDDLHGDGVFVEGDVEVVAVHGSLLRHLQTSSPQSSSDLDLPPTNMGSVRLPCLRAGADVVLGRTVARLPRGRALPLYSFPPATLDPAPLQPLSLGPIAENDASIAELLLDSPAGQPVPDGQHEDRVARDVLGNESHRDRAGLQPLRCGASTDLDTALSHVPLKGIPFDPCFLSELVSRFPGLVALDQVVEVRDLAAGHRHVFDLQTTTGFVVAGGIVTSNCRCVAIPVIGDAPPAAPTSSPSPIPPAPRPPTPRSSTAATPPPRSVPRFIPAPPPTMRTGLIQARRVAPPGPPSPPGPRLPSLPAPPANPVLETRRALVRAVEDEIREETEEHCATQLSDGVTLRSGPDYSRDRGIRDTRVALQVPDAHIDAIRDDGAAVFTHNHPSPNTFSSADLRFAAEVRLLEMRATHSDGGAWVVRRPSGGWGDPEEIHAVLEEAGQEALKRAMLLMDQHIIDAGGDPRDERAATGWSDELWERFGDDEYNVAVRDALGQLGIALEFDR